MLGPAVTTALLAACGGTGTTTTPTASTRPSASSTASTQTAPGSSTGSTETPAAGDGLTGYGATAAAWNAHHQPDARFDPGTTYDPDPSLARNGDLRHDARYYAVLPGGPGGRVNQYYMRFPPRTSVDEARPSVLASEFPAGTSTVKFQTLTTCAILVVQSSKFNGSLRTARRVSSSGVGKRATTMTQRTSGAR
jgi:hypothetical protein